jgi:hypothetical protein
VELWPRAARSFNTCDVTGEPPSNAFMRTIGRLAAVMRSRGAGAPTDSEMDFGAAAFAGLEPRDTAEHLL